MRRDEPTEKILDIKCAKDGAGGTSLETQAQGYLRPSGDRCSARASPARFRPRRLSEGTRMSLMLESGQGVRMGMMWSVLLLTLCGAPAVAVAQTLSADPILKADAPVDPNRPLAQELIASAASNLTLTATGPLFLDSPGGAPPIFDASVTILLKAEDRLPKGPNVTVATLAGPVFDLATNGASPFPWDDAPVIRAAVPTAASLRSQGFDAMMVAADHALDWGIEGMRATEGALDAARLVRAGTGETAGRAAHAAYVDQPSGGGACRVRCGGHHVPADKPGARSGGSSAGTSGRRRD
jgi:hypothetical protein